MLAKQNDEQAVRLAAQETEVAKAKAERELEVLKARAKADIGNLAGSDEVKVAALKAVGAIADQPTRDGVFAMLKGADAAMKSQATAIGTGAETQTENSPLATFNSELAEYAKSKGKAAADVTAEFALSKRGNELYTAAENYRLNGQA
jgi:hypothetical protein